MWHHPELFYIDNTFSQDIMTKAIKLATTIDEQIERLKNRGMIIPDEEVAKAYLWYIGYYRQGFYWFPMEQDYPNKEQRNHLFNEGANFATSIVLYNFDADFRTILNSYLQDIEVDMRAKVIYLISNIHKTNPIWFADKRFVNQSFIKAFTEKYNREIANNDVIKRHAKAHPNDKFAPAWKTLEYMSFGDMERLIEALKDDKEQILIYNCYGFNEDKSFPNYIDVIRIVRNYCAHGHPLFDFISSRSIRAGKFKKVMKGKNLHKDFYSNIQGILVLTQYFLYYLPDGKGDKFREEMKDFFAKRITPDIEPIVGFLKNTPWLENKI